MRGIHIHTGRIRPTKSRVPEGRHRVGRGLAPCIAIKNKPEPRQPRQRCAKRRVASCPSPHVCPALCRPANAGLSSCRGARRGEYSTRAPCVRSSLHPPGAKFPAKQSSPCAARSSRRQMPPFPLLHYARRAFFAKGRLVVPHCWVSMCPL